ncbi:MAG: transglycosylase domain-containing protein, partial [Verrucomicrobiales bacterium]
MPLLREVLKWQAGLLLFPAFLALLWLQRPLPEALKDPPAPHPVLRDRHGEELADFPRADFFRHEPASLSEIPQSLIDATLAAEDKRFYEHPGIDYLATLRAFYQNRRHGRITSGASTITQQLVKISRPPTARTHLTKVHESLLARQVESRWSKDQILLAYLNRLDYGHHQQGCATAARHYFDRSLADLSLAQAALLAGLPQAPSRLNPLRHPAAARERRDWILDRLAAEFAYPPELIARAKAEPLQLSPPARSELTPHLNPAALDSARLTISAPLQRATRAIIRRELAALREKNVQHAALVVIHNPSGEILALHGSADFHAANGGQLNGALLPRSPGSTLKPFTYLLALQDHGLFPGTVIPDIPTRYRTSEGLAAPHNFDHRHHGPVTLRHALANSLNVPAMRVLNQIGGPEPLLRLLQHLDIRHLPADASDLGLG